MLSVLAGSVSRYARADPARGHAARGVIDLRADLGAGKASAFGNFECGDVTRQFRLDPSVSRDGLPSARFEEKPGDAWLAGNGSVRCLAADYHSGEAEGDDYYYGFSLYFPSGAGDDSNLVWVLHQGEELYRYPECSVAPFAVQIQPGPKGERLEFRIVGGNCVPGKGWSMWRPHIQLAGLDPVPRDTWVDLLVHIRFTESANGLVEVWDHIKGAPWPARPAFSLHGIPTIPRCDVCGVHHEQLYTLFGLYTGTMTTKVLSVVNIADYRRGTTFDVVKRGFPLP